MAEVCRWIKWAKNSSAAAIRRNDWKRPPYIKKLRRDESLVVQGTLAISLVSSYVCSMKHRSRREDAFKFPRRPST
jgi:hypothetical protein